MNKVLVVDEERAIRMLYKEELMEEGYDVTTTGAYDSLLEFIADKGPDIIIMDVESNASSRLDILERIRNCFKSIPIILCTADDALMKDRKISAADYFMIKCMDLRYLKNKVGSAIETGKKQLALTIPVSEGTTYGERQRGSCSLKQLGP